MDTVLGKRFIVQEQAACAGEGLQEMAALKAMPQPYRYRAM